MSSSTFARSLPVYPFTPATDFTDKAGCLVTVAGDVATLSASATVPAEGIILEGAAATGQASIGILGASLPPVFMKAGGAIVKGAAVIQGADERVVTDSGAGARVKVGIAMQDAAANELFEVAPMAPQILA